MEAKFNINRSTLVDVTGHDFIDYLVAKTITKKIDTNVATITCDRAHKRIPGDVVFILGLTTHLEYNGYFKVSAVSADGLSFSYALTHADDTVNSDLGGEVHDPIGKDGKAFFIRSAAGNICYSLVGNIAIKTATKKITSNVATITTQGPHGLHVGNTVMISGLGGAHAADYNIYATVTVVSAPNSFSFALTHADDAVNVDAGGCVDECVLKTVAAQVNYIDPEVCRKIFKTGTTATGIYVGYGI